MMATHGQVLSADAAPAICCRQDVEVAQRSLSCASMTSAVSSAESVYYDAQEIELPNDIANSDSKTGVPPTHLCSDITSLTPIPNRDYVPQCAMPPLLLSVLGFSYKCRVARCQPISQQSSQADSASHRSSRVCTHSAQHSTAQQRVSRPCTPLIPVTHECWRMHIP